MRRVLLALTLACLAGDVAAQELGADGKLVFEDDTVVVDLTRRDDIVAVWELDAREVPLQTRVLEDAQALMGNELLALGAQHAPATVDLRTLTEFEGRHVEVRLWFRPNGTDIDADLYWNAADDNLRRTTMFRLPLQPTGRGTSDGWRELTTGTFDWQFLGFSPVLRIMDAALREASAGAFGTRVVTPGVDTEVWIDALSIHDHGERRIAEVACVPIEQQDTCGEAICFAGRCVDGRLITGSPPPTTEARQAVVDRLHVTYATFHGERNRHAKLAELRTDLDAVVNGPPADFYPGLDRAIRKQTMGHSKGPQVNPLLVSAGLCFGAGLADMLPGAPQRPIVFWADESRPEFGDILEGDVLVAVDGVDVDDWIAWDQAHRLTATELYEPLLLQSYVADTAAIRGSTLTFERCPRVDAMPCEPDEVDRYEISMDQVFGEGLRNGDVPFADTCDLRFRRPNGMTRSGSSGAVGVSTIGSNVTWLAFNGFPKPAGTWPSEIGAALEPDASGVILDTRTGNGGDAALLAVVGSPLVDEDVTAGFVDLWDLALENAQVRQRFEACRGDRSLVCENLGAVFAIRTAGVEASHADVPLVVMLGVDGSANDFLPLGLMERSNPLLFLGLAPTFGWFGTFGVAPRSRPELANTWFQPRDSIRVESAEAPLEPPFDFNGGYRVPPDEVCLQTQSDAIRGVDTCVERAVEWLQDQ